VIGCSSKSGIQEILSMWVTQEASQLQSTSGRLELSDMFRFGKGPEISRVCRLAKGINCR